IGGNFYKISYVGVGNRAPTAVENADATNGPLPLTVQFDGSDSSDPDDDALSYSWKFGDGATATGKFVSHRYTSAGDFSATLTVDDGRGGSDTSQPIVISAGNSAPTPMISLPAAGPTHA